MDAKSSLIKTDTLVTRLRADAQARAELLADIGAGPEIGCDETDGLRISLEGGRTLHLRPSGNAPEFRIYVEAEDTEAAMSLLQRGTSALRTRLS